MADTAPARSVARRSGQKAISLVDAKARVLADVARGVTRDEAMKAVGRSVETYRTWMKEDSAFKAEVNRLRSARADSGSERAPVPDFETFCRDWLGQPLHPHQVRMIDALEGREPRDMHPSFRYAPGNTEYAARRDGLPAGRLIVNLPPGFAKTTTISVNYVTWLIHRDPDVKVVIVCKDRQLAVDILGEIKFKLTSPVYAEMHMRFAPEGGWQDHDMPWAADRIFVAGRTEAAKDPTVQALGIRGRIYGARSDIIICDDAVTLANVNEYVPQAKWLQQEVESRLDGAGLLALIGTRIAPTDLYSEMRELDNWFGEKVFSYFSMPAVLDEGSGAVEHWQTLWPERFTPQMLAGARRDESSWALVYQQQDVAEDATFSAKAIEASINRQRFPGPMTAQGMGHRPGGMQGLYVVGGLDPAGMGYTAMQVWGLDRATEKRYVLDGFNRLHCSPHDMKQKVFALTEQYGIHEWVIERNALQTLLTEDQELRNYLHRHGCKLTPHFTNAEKRDPDFGVGGMAQLFLTCGEPPSNGGGGIWRRTPETALIELPNPRNHAWVGELVNQLTVWQPSGMKTNQKTDLVMASWFCEIACKNLLGHGRKKLTHMENRHLSRGRQRQQRVIDLVALREARMAGEVA